MADATATVVDPWESLRWVEAAGCAPPPWVARVDAHKRCYRVAIRPEDWCSACVATVTLAAAYVEAER